MMKPSMPDALPANATLEQRVIAAMRQVYDPEISVNIYDLGLIYDLQINQQKEVAIKMTPDGSRLSRGGDIARAGSRCSQGGRRYSGCTG